MIRRRDAEAQRGGAATQRNIHHRDTETQRRTKAKAKSEGTEMAEATEGCAVAMGPSALRSRPWGDCRASRRFGPLVRQRKAQKGFAHRSWTSRRLWGGHRGGGEQREALWGGPPGPRPAPWPATHAPRGIYGNRGAGPGGPARTRGSDPPAVLCGLRHLCVLGFLSFSSVSLCLCGELSVFRRVTIGG
jgi:hypothetical protein